MAGGRNSEANSIDAVGVAGRNSEQHGRCGRGGGCSYARYRRAEIANSMDTGGVWR
jgi:hypothetical protein